MLEILALVSQVVKISFYFLISFVVLFDFLYFGTKSDFDLLQLCVLVFNERCFFFENFIFGLEFSTAEKHLVIMGGFLPKLNYFFTSFFIRDLELTVSML